MENSNRRLQGKNFGLWARIVPDIVKFLDENPTASCADAAKKFGVSGPALKENVDIFHPGRYDFMERRRLRGEANRAAKRKTPKPLNPAAAAVVRQQCEVILSALANIDKALRSAEGK